MSEGVTLKTTETLRLRLNENQNENKNKLQNNELQYL